jgi:rhamnosyltransferase
MGRKCEQDLVTSAAGCGRLRVTGRSLELLNKNRCQHARQELHLSRGQSLPSVQCSCKNRLQRGRMLEVSILLLTKNDRGNIERLLPALFRQPGIENCEIIAVDSGSTDGSLEILRRFPIRLKQISSQDFHHARTRNYAASLARGNILIFLSQDAIPVSNAWLPAMISNFADAKVGAVYGRQSPKPHSSAERQDVLATIYGNEKLIKDPAQPNHMGYRFYHFSDANAAIRREVWEQVRFPEDLKVFEDLGIAKRILDRGWKIVYEPEAAVIHSHTHSTVGLLKRSFDIGYTVRVLNIWEDPRAKGSLLRDGWKLVRGKLMRAARNQGGRSARHALWQDIAKSIGFFLGINQNHLPVVLKKRLSAFGVFE